MRFKHWFFIILIQIILVAGGLFLYHLYLGGTGIDPGDAITIWATVITIVFIVFSVLGIMNIDGKMKEIDERKADFDFALANCMDVNKSPVYASLGDYYVQKKDFKKAAECFEKALEANPSSSPLCSDLGNVYSALGDFDKAKEYYDRALAINPESAEIYYNKAKRMHDTIPNPTEADNDQMMSYLDKCLSLNPRMFMANINKASILRSQGKEAEAAEVLNQIVVPMLPPDFIMGIEQRGIAYRLTGEYPKALNDFNYVLFYDPHNIQNLSNLAMVNLQMNNLGNADYYARIGLQEAEKQNNHSCDGDFYVVQQTLFNIQNQMPFGFPIRPVREPDPKPDKES